MRQVGTSTPEILKRGMDLGMDLSKIREPSAHSPWRGQNALLANIWRSRGSWQRHAAGWNFDSYSWICLGYGFGVWI